MSDFYKDLGLEPDATPEQIDEAFKRRAKETHPDTGGTADEFQRVRAAHLVLRDPEKRKRYDETGTVEEPKVDKTLQGAMALINAALMEVMENENIDPCKVDVISSMLARINSGIEEAAKVRKRITKRIERYERVLKRFSRKSPDKSPILRILEEEISEYRAQFEVLDRSEAQLKKAVEIISDHEFKFDPPPPPSPKTQASHGLTGAHGFFYDPWKGVKGGL